MDANLNRKEKNARGRHRTDELCSHDSNEVDIELDDVDITSAETKATYDEIKKVQLWMALKHFMMNS